MVRLDYLLVGALLFWTTQKFILSYSIMYSLIPYICDIMVIFISYIPHISHHITSHHSTSHHITLHHITSHHITSHNITSHHITSHHITSHYITSHYITSHHITSHHINHTTSNHITSHHITLHHITSHHITLHHITSHHITSNIVPHLPQHAEGDLCMCGTMWRSCKFLVEHWKMMERNLTSVYNESIQCHVKYEQGSIRDYLSG